MTLAGTTYPRRGFRRVAAGVAALSLGLSLVGQLPGARADAAPSPITTSTGQELSVRIASPSDGSAHTTGGGPVTVDGTWNLTPLATSARPLNVVFTMDVSGSTAVQGLSDCNGDGSSNAIDDYNAWPNQGDILDCEIASLISLNTGLASRPNTEIAAVVFAGGANGDAAIADVSPSAGSQTWTTPTRSDDPTTSAPDMETVARSMTANPGRVARYTDQIVGNSTNYNAGLTRMLSAFASQPVDDIDVGFFLSDGQSIAGTYSNGAGSPVSQLAARGVKVFTYSVGSGGPGCDPSSDLYDIAARTGGSCTRVVAPAQLRNAVADPVTLQSVRLRVNGGALLPVTMSGNTWTADITPVAGPNVVEAVATASDGTQTTASVTIRGVQPPQVDAGPDLYLFEGSGRPAQATVSDDDGVVSVEWTGPAADRLPNPFVEDALFTGIDDEGPYEMTLTATDTDGLTSSDTLTFGVTNVPPRIISVDRPSDGPHTGVEYEFQVSFTDAGYRDTHTDSTVTWGDGTSSTAIIHPDGQTATFRHTYTAFGYRGINVEIIDDDGGVATTSFTVDVNASPIADAGGPYAVDEGSTTPVDGTWSDEDGFGAIIEWSGPAASLLASTTDTSTTMTGADDFHDASGLTLTVTDDDGAVTQSSAAVVVSNVAPRISGVALPGAVTPGSPFTLTGTFDDDGIADDHQVVVDWGDGTTSSGPSTTSVSEASGKTGNAFSASHTYATAGNYTVAVTVSDDDGGSAQRSLVNAITANNRPVVQFTGGDGSGGFAGDEGGPIPLSVVCTDADGNPTSASWSPDTHLVDADTATPTFSAADEGSYPLEVTCTDSLGGTSSAPVSVTVSNVAPTLGTPSSSSNALTVRVTGSFADPGSADVHTVLIDWGDGSSSPATVEQAADTYEASHAYAAGGAYAGVVLIDDGDGGTDAERATFAANRAPTANAGGPYTVAEGSSVALAGSASDPDGDPMTYAWSPADHIDAPTSLTPTFSAATLDDGAQPLTLTASDGHPNSSGTSGTTVTVTNVAPSGVVLSGPVSPVAVGTTVTITGGFADPGSRDTHTVVCGWESGATTAGTVSGRTFSCANTYSTPGIYTVSASVSDDDGGTASGVYEYVVVYDPSGGFVTGGGTITSPAGAYPANPTATGQANFGFVAKYKKGASAPTGATEFQFKAGGLDFHSSTYEWLVVNGAKATFRGAGTVNGVPGHSFRINVVDGSPDRFRIRITGPNGVVYDNEIGADETRDAVTAIASGSIVIHK